MQITIIGKLADDVTPTFLREWLAGVGGVLVPGVFSWDDVAYQDDVLTATLSHVGAVPSGDYAGAEVTPEFVRSYVAGAGDYLFLSEDGYAFFSPENVTVSA